MSIEDVADPQPIVSGATPFRAPIFDLVEETFTLSSAGTQHTRAFLRHPGAVAIICLDSADRVLMIQQYRHPNGLRMWEIPAGLLDVDGEPMLEAAQRELAEEADYSAASWHTLCDFFTTPGSSSEAIRVYLAEQPDRVPGHEAHVREAEESEIVTSWVPLEEAVTAVLEGRISSPSAVVGLLALQAHRSGSRPLRGPRAPWTTHPANPEP